MRACKTALITVFITQSILEGEDFDARASRRKK